MCSKERNRKQVFFNANLQFGDKMEKSKRRLGVVPDVKMSDVIAMSQLDFITYLFSLIQNPEVFLTRIVRIYKNRMLESPLDTFSCAHIENHISLMRPDGIAEFRELTKPDVPK